MPLTDTKIKSLKAKAKPYKIADYDGLFLAIQPSGSKLWRFKYRYLGKEKLLSIGPYPSISLAQARKVRDAARADLQANVDPSEAKQEQKRIAIEGAFHTFEKMADAFILKNQRENKAPATLAKLNWRLDMAKSEFGRKAIKDITSPMVLGCLRKVEARGNYETARRLRAKIGAVFRFAIAEGIADTDPTFALQDALVRPTVTPRAAITNASELGGLLRSIDGFNGQTATRIALNLLAILVQRPGELRHSEWIEFDQEKKIWTIPADRMKMRRPHEVPLPDQAIGLLKELQQFTGHGRLLFPSLRSFHRPMSENTLNAALRRLGYSGSEMTAHGFRASFSTLANESGLWNPDAIERALAHEDKNVIRRAYARGLYWDERVRLADWWAGYLDELRSK